MTLAKKFILVDLFLIEIAISQNSITKLLNKQVRKLENILCAKDNKQKSWFS
jgi:hypothetical protein